MAETLDKKPKNRLSHLKNTSTILNGLKKRSQSRPQTTTPTNANDLQQPQYLYESANDNLQPEINEQGTAINPRQETTATMFQQAGKIAQQGTTDGTEPQTVQQYQNTPNLREVNPETDNKFTETITNEADNILKEYAFKNNPQAYEDLKSTFSHIGDNWKSVQEDFNNNNLGTGTLKLLNTAFETVSAPFPVADAILKQNPSTKLIADGVNYLFENADNLINIATDLEKGAGKEVLKILGIDSDFLDSEGMEQFNLLRKNIAYIVGGEVGIKGFKQGLKPLAEKLGIDTRPTQIKTAEQEIPKFKEVAETGKFPDGTELTTAEMKEVMSEISTREKFVNQYNELFKKPTIEEYGEGINRANTRDGQPLRNFKDKESSDYKLLERTYNEDVLGIKDTYKPTTKNEATSPKNTVENKPVEVEKQKRVNTDEERISMQKQIDEMQNRSREEDRIFEENKKRIDDGLLNSFPDEIIDISERAMDREKRVITSALGEDVYNEYRRNLSKSNSNSIGFDEGIKAENKVQEILGKLNEQQLDEAFPKNDPYEPAEYKRIGRIAQSIKEFPNRTNEDLFNEAGRILTEGDLVGRLEDKLILKHATKELLQRGFTDKDIIKNGIGQRELRGNKYDDLVELAKSNLEKIRETSKPTETTPLDKLELSKQVESVDKDLAEVIKNGELSPDELKVIQESLPKEVVANDLQKPKEVKRIISDETYTKAKENIFKPSDKLSSNPIDFYAEKLKDLTTIGAYHIENGLRDFGSWSKKMIEEVGEKVKPYLKQLWKDTNKEQANRVFHGTKDLGGNPTLKRNSLDRDGYRTDAVYFTEDLPYAKRYVEREWDNNSNFKEGKVYETRLDKKDLIFDATNSKHLEQLKKGYEELAKDGETYNSLQDAMYDYKNHVRYIKEGINHGALDWSIGNDYLPAIEKAGFKGAKLLERGIEQEGGKPVYSYALFKDVPVKEASLIKPESYNQAVKNLKDRTNQINSNPFDPTVFKDIYTIGKFHLESGLKNFTEWSKKVIQDLGERIKPHLQKLWTEINKDRTGLKDAVTQGADFDKILDMMKSKKMIDETKYNAIKEKKKLDTGDIEVGEKKGSKEMNEKTLNAELREVGKQFAEDNPELIAEAKRQRITVKQMIENATKKAEYLTDNDIKNLKAGDIKNTEEAMSLAMYQQAKIRKVLKDTTIDELQRADLVAKAFQDYVKVNAIYSEGARLIGSKRFLPDLPIEDLKSYADMLKNTDSELYNSIIGEVNKLEVEQSPTARDKITRILYELMLSRPTTHVRNIVGNSVHLGYELGTMALSNPLDIPKIVRGLKNGAKEIPSEIRKTLKGEDNSQVKFVDFKYYAPKNNVARNILPTTWLKIEDNFFKALSKGVETEFQKKILSKDTKESLNVVSDNIKKVLDGKLLETPDKTAKYLQSIEEINKFADYITFQAELGKFGKGLTSLQNSSNLGIGLKLLVPFVKTPANILKAGFAPLRVLKFASKEFRQKYSEMSAREKSHVNRRIIAGTVFYSTIASLVASDVIQVTGSGIIDKSKRDYLEKIGYKPNHIYVNGVGFSYQNLPPFSQLLGLLGNYSDGLKYNVKPKDEELNLPQKITKSLAGFISTTTDQSFLSGISEFFKFVETGNENYWERFATMPMPAVLSSYKDFQTYFKGDNTDYETNSFSDRLGKRTGFYGDMKAKLNVFGEDKKTIYETLPIPSKLNTKDDNTRLERFLLENNINIGYPSENIIKSNGETLTKEEYRNYLQKAGQELKKAIMNGTVDGKNSFEYLTSIPIDEANKEIKHLRDKIRDDIKEDLFGKKENKSKKYNYKLKAN